jgi:Spy/CpxP family protein refolding chaperone
MLMKLAVCFIVVTGLLASAPAYAEKPKSGDIQMPAAAAPADQTAAGADVKLHGRLPQFYSKLDVSTEQRQKIYKIQASYASRMDALEKQLQDLKTQCNAEARTVLTADQQAKLDELASERKTKKSKDVKSTDAKPATAAESNKVTESAAK